MQFKSKTLKNKNGSREHFGTKKNLTYKTKYTILIANMKLLEKLVTIQLFQRRKSCNKLNYF